MAIQVDQDRGIWTVIIDRHEARNAIDTPHATALLEAFEAFEADAAAQVAVLWGRGGTFCAGADLKAVASNRMQAKAPGKGAPGMGPTRLLLSKPVIAAVDGHAVAGGLELALWCDLRVVDPSAVFGVFCRRWGVPLIDGGTVRLPRLIGQSAALDMILTGREVGAEEALSMHLANRISAAGRALEEAQELAGQVAAFPQICTRSDRMSAIRQHGLDLEEAIALEWEMGTAARRAESGQGAARFASGRGRHGSFDDL